MEKLAAIEKSEGKQARYHVEALMIQAKRVLRAEDTEKPDVAAITQALNDYESIDQGRRTVCGPRQRRQDRLDVRQQRQVVPGHRRKHLMRRIRDKVPYSAGDKMMLGNAGGGWMVEGSPPRLLRDYNQLVDAYNRGARI